MKRTIPDTILQTLRAYRCDFGARALLNLILSPRTDVFSAKGAASAQPGATPQEIVPNWRRALKARLNGRDLDSIRQKLNRAFSAKLLLLHKALGRCPRLLLIAAPLALNGSPPTDRSRERQG